MNYGFLSKCTAALLPNFKMLHHISSYDSDEYTYSVKKGDKTLSKFLNSNQVCKDIPLFLKKQYKLIPGFSDLPITTPDDKFIKFMTKSKIIVDNPI